MPKLKNENENCQCSVCGNKFSCASGLRSHMYKHTGERPFKCNFCPSAFTRKCTLNEHLALHVPEKALRCSVCDAAYTNTSSLKNHMLKHTGERPFKCEFCDATFAVKGSLKDHVLIHTREKMFKCGVCNLHFVQKSNLKKHLRTHEQDRPFECNFCDTPSTFTWKEYKDHMVTHTNLGQSWFTCGYCDAKYTTGRYLKEHLLKHTSQPSYICCICEAAFWRRGNLNAHMSVHIQTRDFECSMCESKFSQENSLYKHMARIHTNQKPYKCMECPAKFSSSSNLTIHKKIHTGDKPYKCTDCTASFGRELNLEKHLALHRPCIAETFKMENENYLKAKVICKRPPKQQHRYNCIVCNTVLRKKDVRKHMAQHINVDLSSFECHLCDDLCCHKRDLNCHMENSVVKVPLVLKKQKTIQIFLEEEPTSAKFYRCSECVVKFESESDLEVHLASHDSEKTKDNVQDCVISVYPIHLELNKEVTLYIDAQE